MAWSTWDTDFSQIEGCDSRKRQHRTDLVIGVDFYKWIAMERENASARQRVGKFSEFKTV